jgi:hypothetical protein
MHVSRLSQGCYLERIQKHALAIIYPSHSYEDALSLTDITTLNSRGDTALYTLSRRSRRSERTMMARTDRFWNFVTVKYAKIGMDNNDTVYF